MRFRGLAVALLLLLPLVGVHAQSPPVPEALAGEFQVSRAQGGAEGIYMLGQARDIGAGFEQIGDEERLLRFKWLGEAEVPTPTHARQPVQRILLEHQGWTRDAEERRDHQAKGRWFNSTVHVDAGGSNHGAQEFAGAMGETHVLDRRYIGSGWGDVPCGMSTEAHRGMDLATDELHFACRIAGIWLDGPFTPVARMRLGEHDTVVFHKARQGGMGERWVWFSEDVPLPLAMVFQHDKTRLFDVVRLTHFDAGDEPLSWERRGPKDPWPDHSRMQLGAIPDMSGDETPFGPGEAMRLLDEHPDLAGARDWLQAHPGAWLRSVEPWIQALAPDGTVQGGSVTLAFLDEAVQLRVEVRRDPDADYVDDPVECLVRTSDPACLTTAPGSPPVETTVSWWTSDCTSCLPWRPGLEAAELASPEAAHARARGLDVGEDGASMISWGFERGCEYWDGCAGGWSVATEVVLPDGDGRAATLDWRIRHLPGRDDLGAHGTAERPTEVHGLTTGTWVPRPGRSPETDDDPPLLGLEPAARILQILQDTGVMDDVPLVDDPTASDAHASTDDTDDPALPSATGVRSTPAGASVAGDRAGLDAAIVATAAGIGALGIILLLAKGWIFGGLFSRIDRHKVLTHPLRSQVHEVIVANPGIHLGALTRRLDRSSGVVRHHVQKLIETGLVQKQEGKGVVTYFARGAVDHGVVTASPVLASLSARRVMREVLRNPGTSPGALAKGLGLSPGTVSHHVRRLETAGLLERRRRGVRVALEPDAAARQTLRNLGVQL